MMKKVLMVHMNKDQEKRVSELCHSLAVEPVSVLAADYGQKLGYLAGIDGFLKESIKSQFFPVVFRYPLLIFCGLDSALLDRFLEAYGAAGLTDHSLKAVVTMHNISWNIFKLYEELLKEQEAMKKK